jgi:hypothetical protein
MKADDLLETDFHVFLPAGYEPKEGIPTYLVCWRCLMDQAIYDATWWSPVSGEHFNPEDVAVDDTGRGQHIEPIPPIPMGGYGSQLVSAR